MESPALSLISANQDLIAVSASPRKVTFNKLIWNYLVSGTTRCSPKKSHLAWNDQLLARNFFSCPLLPLKVSCFVQLLAITFYLVDGMLPNLWIKEKSQLDLEMNCGGSEQVTPRRATLRTIKAQKAPEEPLSSPPYCLKELKIENLLQEGQISSLVSTRCGSQGRGPSKDPSIKVLLCSIA